MVNIAGSVLLGGTNYGCSAPITLPTPSSSSGPPTSVPTSFPDATDTGPLGLKLTAYTGSYNITQDNVSLKNVILTQPLTVSGKNFSLVGFKAALGSFSIITLKDPTAVLTDGDIDGLGITAGANGLNGCGTFKRLNIHGVENCWNGSGGPSLMQDCYLWGLKAPGSPHYDNVQIDGGCHDILIDHITAINDYSQTSAIMTDNYFGPLNNIIVQRSRLVGGGYTVYADDTQKPAAQNPMTGIQFLYNRMGKGFYGDDALYTTKVNFVGNIDDKTGLPV